ncbi:hypothetical protein C8D87_1199 [Lentzea atacamensis]|uniref:Uncharacterized protein n=1 Tax=Lentzea atacamensis TaxID=531938 RepID=A0ABX9DXM2_9PSEU|nr:hypothetical protein [Lentzea atacamensis]RAS57944.1 hypothetical protein C8D87_1199 [Lentzea atacamensis]
MNVWGDRGETRSLFKDLRTTGLVKTVRNETDAPAGSKSGTAAQVGELVITGAFSTATVATPGRMITAYTGRTKARSVIWQDSGREADLIGVSEKEQLALVELLADERDDPSSVVSGAGRRGSPPPPARPHWASWSARTPSAATGCGAPTVR